MKKKILCIVTAAIIALSFAGCGSSSGNSDSTNTSDSDSVTSNSSSSTPSAAEDVALTTMLDESPEWITKLPEAKDAKQLFVVAAYEGTTAWVSLNEKDSSGIMFLKEVRKFMTQIIAVIKIRFVLFS